MTEYNSNDLPLMKDQIPLLKSGVLVTEDAVTDDNDMPIVFEFLKFRHCKWLDGEGDSDCPHCHGEAVLRDLRNGKDKRICHGYTEKKTEYCLLKLYNPPITFLSEEEMFF